MLRYIMELFHALHTSNIYLANNILFGCVALFKVCTTESWVQTHIWSSGSSPSTSSMDDIQQNAGHC